VKNPAPENAGRRGAGRGFWSAFAGTLLFFLALPFLCIAGWAVLFGAPTAAVIAFTISWLALPLFNRIRLVRVLKLGVFFIVLPAAFALTPLMISEVDGRIEELAGRDRYDRDAFDLRDKLGIYGLNIVMGLAGLPLYPEASRETMLMVLDPGPTDRRVLRSAFGLGSPRLRLKLAGFARTLGAADTAATRQFGPARILWDASDYRFSEPEARYALALNQTTMSATARKEGGRWWIDVRHEVEIRYPDSLYATLIGRPRLRVEEGLFWVLQNAGWLHPYMAEWRFGLYADDPRLR
jgi:hypothetical protein